MEKIITIGDREVKLVSSAATPIFYKAAFHRDFFADLSGVIETMSTFTADDESDNNDEKKVVDLESGNTDLEQDDKNVVDKLDMGKVADFMSSGDVTNFYNFLWIYAKNADKNIIPFEEWISSFDELPILEFMPDLVELMMTSITTKKD
ncbi:MAG: hypothetical protein LBT37_06520 [Lactobacillaceae bacterium]|jgi:hypothetical protein|nr:hypothetical protein [Lactobacillaceae bacterium]